MTRLLGYRLATKRKLLEQSRAFQLQKFFFGFQPATVAGERAVCSDDPVAWHNNGDGIVMIGLANGAEGARAAYLFGQLRIRAGVAVGNAAQRVPALLLEVCADQVQI